jgi:hypothetical protein
VELLRHELLSLTRACKRSCNVGTRFRLGSLLFSTWIKRLFRRRNQRESERERVEVFLYLMV